MKISVEIDGKNLSVDRARYALAKLKQLREFGYEDLTLETVQSEISAVIAGDKLTVIGMFMKDEIKDRAEKKQAKKKKK